MNQVIVALVGIFVIGLVYFVCSHLKYGTCDMGKLFNLLVVVISFVTGIFLCIHAVQSALASQKDEVAWGGVAGFILTVFSLEQAIVVFRELIAKKVEPRKIQNSDQN